MQVDLAKWCQHLKHSIIWYAHSNALSLLGFARLIISALLWQLFARFQDECVLHMHMICNTSLEDKEQVGSRHMHRSLACDRAEATSTCCPRLSKMQQEKTELKNAGLHSASSICSPHVMRRHNVAWLYRAW